MDSKLIVKRLKEKIKKDHPEINLLDFKIPLTNGVGCGTLKDILEEKVDEKYYVDPKRYDNLSVEKVIESKFTRNK